MSMSQSATKKTEKQEAIDRLREWLKPGDTVYTILRHVSRSGMQREISMFALRKAGGSHDPKEYPFVVLDPSVCAATGQRIGKHDGVVVGGCGEDKGFVLVYDLSRTLFRDGYGCIGEGCPSNDHSNGDRSRTPHYDGAVTLKPSESVRAVVWHERNNDDGVGETVGIWGEVQPSGARAFTPQNGELTIYLFDDEVDSDEPAPQHWHSDGGYALRARWM